MMRLLICGKWCDLPYEDMVVFLMHHCHWDRAELFDQSKSQWVDVTEDYMHLKITHLSTTNQNKRGMLKLKEIKVLPKFKLGEVLDLSYTHGGLPNRIIIDSVGMRKQNTEWVYGVTMENNGESTQMAESFIAQRMSYKKSSVYENPEIIKRYDDGWRFCGNFPANVANANAKMIAESSAISSVRLYRAIDSHNRFDPDKMGIWIKYINVINDDGTITNQRAHVDFVNIK